MKQWKTIVTIAFFAALVAFWPGAPATAQTLEFYQLDFDLNGTITQNTDWGMVDLTYTGSTNTLYFNLTINGSWQIQNIPLISIEGAGTTQTQSFSFDLGNDVGEDVTSLNYAYQLTTDTLGSAPSGSTPASVSDEWIVLYNGVGGPPGRQEPPPAGPMVGGEADGPGCKKEGVPNQECRTNECTPAAVSNSLKYLEAKFNLVMPPNDIETMKGATGCTPPPASPDWPAIKKQYMKDHGYPISTEVYGPGQIDKVFEELCRCQDVEMEVKDGIWHDVTVVGMKKLKNGKWEIDLKDDGNQAKPGEPLNNGGLRTKTITFDPSTGKFTDGDRFKGTRLLFFVVECPLVPPGNNFGLFPTDALPFEGAEETIYVVEYQAPSPDTGDWHDRNYNGILDSCDYVKVHWVRPSEDSCRYDWLHVVGKYIVNLDRIVDDGEDGIWTPCDSVYKHFKTPPYFCHTYRYHVERVGKWRGLWVVKQEYDPRVHEIPTLTEWSLIIFGVLLLGFITWVFLKRRKVVGVRA